MFGIKYHATDSEKSKTSAVTRIKDYEYQSTWKSESEAQAFINGINPEFFGGIFEIISK